MTDTLVNVGVLESGNMVLIITGADDDVLINVVLTDEEMTVLAEDITVAVKVAHQVKKKLLGAHGVFVNLEGGTA